MLKYLDAKVGWGWSGSEWQLEMADGLGASWHLAAVLW